MSIVESYAASIDERHTAFSHDTRDFAFYDHRGVLIQSESHDLRIVRDCDEQTIKSSALREVRIDQCFEAEQAQSGTDVLLHELSLFIHFIACKRHLGECS